VATGENSSEEPPAVKKVYCPSSELENSQSKSSTVFSAGSWLEKVLHQAQNGILVSTALQVGQDHHFSFNVLTA